MADPSPTQPPPRNRTRRVLRNAAGLLLLLAGIAGLFLPFVQGILLMIGGLAMIDLPIKGQIHRRLTRYRWYQRLNRKHDAWRQTWLDYRARSKAKRRKV